MKTKRPIKLALIAAIAMVSSCSAHQGKSVSSFKPADKNQSAPISTTIQIGDKKMSLDQYESRLRAMSEAEPSIRELSRSMQTKPALTKYSLHTSGMEDIRSVLGDFARINGLNIVIDKDVKGKVSISLNRMPLEKLLKYILEPSGFYVQYDGDLIYIREMEDAILEVSYPRFARSMSGSTSLSSGSSSSSSPSSSSNSSSSSNASGGTSEFIISNTDNLDFLSELDTELESLVSEDGKYSINKMSGIIHVFDHHRNVNEIRKYLDHVDQAIHRQVALVATIMMVDTTNFNKLGVDWDVLSKNVTSTINTAIQNPVGIATGALLNPTFKTTISNTPKSIKSVITALKEQGDVDIISKPHLRTINNQPALIKIGTDRTFFSVNSTVNNTTSGSTITVSDIASKITEGLVMSITPQISKDMRVTLNINPIITSLNGTDTSVNGSVAPRLDIKQLSSVVSIMSGESVIIGGLIDKSKSKNVSSIPGLGDIPFISGLFSTTQEVETTKELVIILTPYVITN